MTTGLPIKGDDLERRNDGISWVDMALNSKSLNTFISGNRKEKGTLPGSRDTGTSDRLCIYPDCQAGSSQSRVIQTSGMISLSHESMIA